MLTVEGMGLHVRPALRPAVELVEDTMVVHGRETDHKVVAFMRRFKRLHDLDAIQDMDLLPLVRQQLIREGLLDGH